MTNPSETESSLSKIFKGGSILFVGLILELFLSFAGKLIIARFLGPIDYGSVTLGLAIMTFTMSFVMLGLNSGIGRYLPRYTDPADRRGVLVSGFRTALITAIVVSVAFVSLAPWIARLVFGDSSLTPVFRIFGSIIPAAVLMRLSIGAIQGLQLSRPRVYIENITMPLTRFLGFVGVALLGLGAIGAAWAYFISYSTAAILGLYYTVRHTSLLSFDIDTTLKDRELLMFSLPLAFSGFMAIIYQDVDTILLGYFYASGEVGIYNVVYPLAKLITLALSAVAFIFMPVISELHSDGAYDDMHELYQVVTKWIFTVSFPLFLIVALFPTMSLKVTFGPDYLAGAASLSVLAFAFFSHAVAGPNVNALTSIGKTKYVMYDASFTAILNVILNLILIPRYSFYGAAVATGISYVTLNSLYTYQLYKTTGIHPFTRELLIPGTIGATLVGAIYLVSTTYLTITIPVLVVLFGAFVVLYSIVVLRFGIEESEIALVMELEVEYNLNLGPAKKAAKTIMDLEE